MRLLVDECTGPAVATWLRGQGHDVVSIFDEARGYSDDAVIARAFAEGRVLITSDKDFGEKVFRVGRPHHGVILLRLSDDRTACKIDALRQLLTAHEAALPASFVVVTENAIRFSRTSAP